MLGTQLVVSNLGDRGVLTPSLLLPVVNRPYTDKPGAGGFWTSSYSEADGSGWIQWCEDRQWGVPCDGVWEGYLIEVDSKARIYTVDSVQDLMRLCTLYPLVGPHDELNKHMGNFVDYERMSADYDGMHLTELGEWATRHSYPFALRDWSCESTLWFRWMFTDVAPITLNRGEIAC